MSYQKTEPRYSKLLKDLKSSRIGKVLTTSVRKYSLWGWTYTKKILWGLSVGAIVLLLPLAIEATLEGEAQVQHLNSQLNHEISPNVELRPY